MKPEQIMKTAWALIIDRIKELREQKATYEEIGKLCGVSKATIQRWYNSGEGGEDTPFVNMFRYLKGLNIPVSDVISSDKPLKSITGQKVEDTSSQYDLSDEDLTVLGVHCVAGAGPAWNASDSKALFSIAVPKMFLCPNIVAIAVSGESMSPTILNGAVVGVDRDARDIVQGHIYAVRLPYEGVVVKRIYLDHESECFILRSDNNKDKEEFTDIRLPFVDGDNFIFGRVMWVLQSYYL